MLIVSAIYYPIPLDEFSILQLHGSYTTLRLQKYIDNILFSAILLQNKYKALTINLSRVLLDMLSDDISMLFRSNNMEYDF